MYDEALDLINTPLKGDIKISVILLVNLLLGGKKEASELLEIFQENCVDRVVFTV